MTTAKAREELREADGDDHQDEPGRFREAANHRELDERAERDTLR